MNRSEKLKPARREKNADDQPIRKPSEKRAADPTCAYRPESPKPSLTNSLSLASGYNSVSASPVAPFTPDLLLSSVDTREAFASAQEMSAKAQDALGDAVSGVYLHGSLAIGGFNPRRSDIDLLIVVDRVPDRRALHALTRATLNLHDRLPEGRAIEFTVVEDSALRVFTHPAPFVYHYSSAHRDKYAADPNYICGGWTDPDLAAQVAVAYERGIALYGRPLRETYPPVPETDYRSSILHDVSTAETDILHNPVYVVLNLCRVLLFAEEKRMSSKQEGGEWALEALPQWQDVVETALNAYRGTDTGQPTLGAQRGIKFAKEMLDRIHRIYGHKAHKTTAKETKKRT